MASGIHGNITTTNTISGNAGAKGDMRGSATVPTSGAKSYNQLEDKPMINSVTVEGNKNSAAYRLQDKMTTVTAQEIDTIIYG